MTLGLAAAAVADPGVSFTNYPAAAADGNITIGYQFDVTSTVTVYALGFFTNPNKGNNTLAESHEVGLWDPSGTLLATTIVTDSDMLIGMDKWSSIAPQVLTPGDGYIVGGYTPVNGDEWAYGDYSQYTGLTSAPGISNALGYYQYAGTFTKPTGSYWQMYGGGNILTNAIPEPTPFAALGIGALGLLIRRRRS